MGIMGVRVALISVGALLASCASLRSGWARVDFITGKPTDVMVCSFSFQTGDDGETETVGRCADFDVMSEGLSAAGHERKLRALRP